MNEMNEKTLWWKVALHIDEAQTALAQAMALNTEDPAWIFALQSRLSESQALLLAIFQSKGLVPAGTFTSQLEHGAPPPPAAPDWQEDPATLTLIEQDIAAIEREGLKDLADPAGATVVAPIAAIEREGLKDLSDPAVEPVAAATITVVEESAAAAVPDIASGASMPTGQTVLIHGPSNGKVPAALVQDAADPDVEISRH